MSGMGYLPPDFLAREAAESFNITQAIVIHLGCAPEIQGKTHC